MPREYGARIGCVGGYSLPHHLLARAQREIGHHLHELIPTEPGALAHLRDEAGRIKAPLGLQQRGAIDAQGAHMGHELGEVLRTMRISVLGAALGYPVPACVGGAGIPFAADFGDERAQPCMDAVLPDQRSGLRIAERFGLSAEFLKQLPDGLRITAAVAIGIIIDQAPATPVRPIGIAEAGHSGRVEINPSTGAVDRHLTPVRHVNRLAIEPAPPAQQIMNLRGCDAEARPARLA